MDPVPRTLGAQTAMRLKAMSPADRQRTRTGTYNQDEFRMLVSGSKDSYNWALRLKYPNLNA